jgi:hypothetical protein
MAVRKDLYDTNVLELLERSKEVRAHVQENNMMKK